MKAYSGTILANYQKCAVIEGDKVHYVKSRQRKSTFRDLFLTNTIQNAAWYATLTTMKIGGNHSPVIIAGESNHKSTDPLNRHQGNESFPVEEIWVLREGIEFSDEMTNEFANPLEDNVDKFFKKVDPLEMLVNK